MSRACANLLVCCDQTDWMECPGRVDGVDGVDGVLAGAPEAADRAGARASAGVRALPVPLARGWRRPLPGGAAARAAQARRVARRRRVSRVAVPGDRPRAPQPVPAGVL